MNSKWYIGIRQRRVSDEQEAELLDEFIKAAHRRFGDKLVIHVSTIRISELITMEKLHLLQWQIS